MHILGGNLHITSHTQKMFLSIPLPLISKRLYSIVLLKCMSGNVVCRLHPIKKVPEIQDRGLIDLFTLPFVYHFNFHEQISKFDIHYVVRR